MTSSPVLKPHIDPDADGTFDSHYYPHATVDDALALKADQTALDAVAAAKADQAALDTTNTTVSTKADQSAVTAITPDTLDQGRLAFTGITVAKDQFREAYLNDRNDIDPTGVADMATVIPTYLAEFAAKNITHVVCKGGSTYLTSATIDVPLGLTLIGPGGKQTSATSQRAAFKASADNMTILRLAAWGSSLSGITIDLNSKLNVVGVRPNNHQQRIDDCYFRSCDASSTGVKGGGILYFGMARNVFSGSWLGRAVDLLDAYADNPAGVYYGVNVGWFEQNIFAGPPGAFRAEGIFSVFHNDFEGGSGSVGPAVEVSTASANSYVAIDRNYFEMSSGASQAILLGSGASATVTRNYVSGVQSAVGGYGVKAPSYCYYLDLGDNTFFRLETGVSLGAATDANWAGYSIRPNTYSFCTTNMAGGPAAQKQQTWTDMTKSLGAAFMHRGDGRITHWGAVVGGSCNIYSGSGSVIDLRTGNSFRIQSGAATTLTAANQMYGQRIVLYNQSGGGITLPNATWHPVEGADIVLANGEVRQFFVDYANIIREVGWRYPKQAAITTATNSTLNTGDATSDAEIANMRTRIGDLESRLRSLGLLT